MINFSTERTIEKYIEFFQWAYKYDTKSYTMVCNNLTESLQMALSLESDIANDTIYSNKATAYELEKNFSELVY